MYEIRTLEETQIPELIAFLTRVFDMPATSRSVQPALLRWKMFEPHPFWQGSRSYGAWHEGRIVAHGCVLPALYRYNGGEAKSQVIIDWAADPVIRGGGVLVYQALSKLTDIQAGIGGSDEARKVLPRMRFATRQTVGTYTRVQNPLQNQASAGMDWKTPLRIGRDVLRQVQQGGLGDSGSLRARAVTEFDESVPMPEPHDNVVSVRTPALLNYALHCPNTEIEGYVLESADGAAVGYCLLTRVGTECRIADLWTTGPWNEAISLAARLAARKPCGSVVMNASVAAVRMALEQQGFRLRVEWPLFIKDTAKKLPPNQELHVSMLDNDAFYL